MRSVIASLDPCVATEHPPTPLNPRNSPSKHTCGTPGGNHPRMLSRNLIILQQVRLWRTEMQSPGYSSWRGSTHPCEEKTRASLSWHPIREGGLRDLVSILRVQVEPRQREGRVATGSLGGETRRLPPLRGSACAACVKHKNIRRNKIMNRAEERRSYLVAKESQCLGVKNNNKNNINACGCVGATRSLGAPLRVRSKWNDRPAGLRTFLEKRGKKNPHKVNNNRG